MLGSVDIQDIENISTHLREMGEVYALDANVHTYTRQIGNHFKNCFYPLDVKHQLSFSGNFTQTYQDILYYCKNDPLVKSALDTLAASTGKIEPETGINGQDLLVRTWQLAKKQVTYANALDVVIDNLRQNKLTNGGCLAGIVGRLVLPYAHFVDNAIQDKMFPEARHAQPYLDEETQIALALSLSESKETKDEIAAFEESFPQANDKEMEMALALSLSEYEAKQTQTNNYFDVEPIVSLSPTKLSRTLTFTRFERKADFKQRLTEDGFSIDELEYTIELSKLIC